MFEFIGNWNTALKDVQQDLEFSIRGEVKSWVIHLQTYLEKLLKILYFENNTSVEKTTLGDLLRDEIFTEKINSQVDFGDINWLRKVNSTANDIKHNSRYKEFSETEMKEWIQKTHRISLGVYNCLHQQKINEPYDPNYVSKLLQEKDEAEESLIKYADYLLLKRSQQISDLHAEIEMLKSRLQEKEKANHEIQKQLRVTSRHKEKYQADLANYDSLIDEIFGRKDNTLGIAQENLDRTVTTSSRVCSRVLKKYRNVVRNASIAELTFLLWKKQEELLRRIFSTIELKGDNLQGCNNFLITNDMFVKSYLKAYPSELERLYSTLGITDYDDTNLRFMKQQLKRFEDIADDEKLFKNQIQLKDFIQAEGIGDFSDSFSYFNALEQDVFDQLMAEMAGDDFDENDRDEFDDDDFDDEYDEDEEDFSDENDEDDLFDEYDADVAIDEYSYAEYIADHRD